MSYYAFEFTCVACAMQSTASAEELRSEHVVECSLCGALNDKARVIPDAVRTAVEQSLDARWPGAYLGMDTEDWATNTHNFVIRADGAQYRLIIGAQVRRSGDVRGAVDAIRESEAMWIQLLKDGGSVLFTIR